MTRLSVNINKIATLRNARGGLEPNVLHAATEIQRFGADGITVHPRPDERHIRYADVRELKERVHTEFNVEGYPNAKFLQLVSEVLPEQVTLVPDSPDVLTSNAGWDTNTHFAFLKDTVQSLQGLGMRVSLFMDPSKVMIARAKEIGCDRIELYTEAYASQYSTDRAAAIAPFKDAAEFATEIGLSLNAGHDLNMQNLRFFASEILALKEVSIGHALIADALYLGMEECIKRYKAELLVSS